MPKQYLEIDSTYRNRNLFPNPASFTIQTNLYNTETTRLNAVDPVCDDASIVSYEIKELNFQNIELVPLTNKSGEMLILDLKAGGNGSLQPTKNYYYGATIRVDVPAQSSRVLSYEYQQDNRCIIKPETRLVVTSTSNITIISPTNNVNEFFIPNGPHSVYFVGHLLHLRPSNFFIPIVSHDIERSVVKIILDDSFMSSFIITPPRFGEIRKKQPMISEQQMDYLNLNPITASISATSFPFKKLLDISNVQVGDFVERLYTTTFTGDALINNARQIQLDSIASDLQNAYVGGILRLIANSGPNEFSEDKIIVDYTSAKVVTIESDIVFFLTNGITSCKYKIFQPTESKRITKIINETLNADDVINPGGGNPQTIDIINNSNASIESGFYKDFYITNAASQYGYIIDHKVIKTSQVLINTLTVNPEFTINTNDTIQIHSCKLGSPFKASPFAKSKEFNYNALFTLNGHTDDVLCVAFNHDGTKIASGSSDFDVKIWDVATEALDFTLVHTAGVTSVAFNHDGTKIASGSSDFDVIIWDVATQTLDYTLTGHTGDVNSVAFNHDGTKIASGSSDFDVIIWDDATQLLDFTLTGHTDIVFSVAFNHDGTRIVSGSRDNTVIIWDASTGTILNALTNHTDDVNSVAFNHDGTKIASGSRDNTVKIWNVAPLQLLFTLTGHTEPVTSVAFNHDGTRIASGSNSGDLKIGDVLNGIFIATFEGEDSLFSVDFNHDGTRIALGSEGNEVQVLDATPSDVFNSFSIIKFTRDNRVFMRGGTDHTRTVIDEFEITLTNLILPNRPLKCSKGGYITEYPYVYVRFSNPAIFKPNYFLSNSPHTEGVTFRVPITNFVDDQTTDFVTLVAGDMTYTTMFTFSEDIHFEVTLPDGSIFETIETDFFSPLSSNTNLQISAFFEIRKLNNLS